MNLPQDTNKSNFVNQLVQDPDLELYSTTLNIYTICLRTIVKIVVQCHASFKELIYATRINAP
jgi:hypothetical protein